MVRTQILLEPSQHQRLRQEAMTTGRSVSAIVRECIEAHLGELESDPLLKLVACVRKENDPAPQDLAARHDTYLYGAKR